MTATSTRSSQNLPVVSLLASITAVQISSAAATQIFNEVGAAGGALLGVGIAALVLLVAVRPSWAALRGPVKWQLLGYGVVLGLLNLSFYQGIDRVSLGVAVSIEFCGPLTVGAIYAGRGHRRWVLAAAVGVLLLTRPWSADQHADPVGVAWLVLDSICWGSYIVLGARAARALPGLQPISIAMAISAAILLLPGISSGGAGLLASHVLMIGLFVAVVGQVIPYSLEQLALRRLTPGAFGVLMALEPAIAALTGQIFLSQALDLMGWLGITAVITAGIAVTRATRTRTLD